MTSIKDVAKHAGVAISTVSKVLNNYPNISDATRKKVNKAVLFAKAWMELERTVLSEIRQR